MQWQEHKCSSPSHSNSTKATNAIKRYERKNKGGESQRTPRSRSKRFPHLEQILIGGNVDLDLLSLFPKKDSTSMGEIESRAIFKVNNGGERVGRSNSPRGKNGTFYSPFKI
jgi:hypothetical protein